MNLKWLALVALAFGSSRAPASSLPPVVPVAVEAVVPHSDAAPAQRVYTSIAVVDDLFLEDKTLYVASTGGVARIDLDTRVRRIFSRAAGLIEIQKRRALHAGPSGVASVSSVSPERIDGWRVTARAATADGWYLGTSGGGVYWEGNAAHVAAGIPLVADWGAVGKPDGVAHLAWDDDLADPFVHDLVAFRGELWVAGFSAGTSVLSHGHMRSVHAPFRYPNRMLVAGDTLYVAANEGLFFSRDGAHFERVDAIEQRGVNGLAVDGDRLYVTVPAALHQMRLPTPNEEKRVANAGPALVNSYFRPAGTRSLQGVTVSADRVYLASEDRGIIAFERASVPSGGGRGFTAWDRLAGLPSSWVVDVAGDGAGGVFAGTLRHGVIHLDAAGHFTAVPSPAAWTLRVAPAADGLWVGTQQGMTRTAATQSMRLPDERVHARLEFDGSLYIGTEAGLLEIPRA